MFNTSKLLKSICSITALALALALLATA